MPKKIYLASGLGFSEFGRYAFDNFKEKLKSKFILFDPFEINSDLGRKIEKITQNKSHSLDEISKTLQSINMEIGKSNEKSIKESDFILANLDGTEVDSGTAAEIGYAYALKKKIIGYRGDFRNSGDNLGSENLNLQIFYFIKASGGILFHKIDELISYLINLK